MRIEEDRKGSDGGRKSVGMEDGDGEEWEDGGEGVGRRKKR